MSTVEQSAKNERNRFFRREIREATSILPASRRAREVLPPPPRTLPLAMHPFRVVLETRRGQRRKRESERFERKEEAGRARTRNSVKEERKRKRGRDQEVAFCRDAAYPRTGKRIV